MNLNYAEQRQEVVTINIIILRENLLNCEGGGRWMTERDNKAMVEI